MSIEGAPIPAEPSQPETVTTVSTVTTIDQSTIIDGGGLLQGPDKQLSLRRVIGITFAGVGIVALLVSMGILASIISKIVMDPIAKIDMWNIILLSLLFFPGSILILFSFFIMKQISAQAIASIIGKKE